MLLNISEFILERDLINVKSVTKPLFSAHILLSISEFILERDLIAAPEGGWAYAKAGSSLTL